MLPRCYDDLVDDSLRCGKSQWQLLWGLGPCLGDRWAGIGQLG
jgi:hypothetical protein